MHPRQTLRQRAAIITWSRRVAMWRFGGRLRGEIRQVAENSPKSLYEDKVFSNQLWEVVYELFIPWHKGRLDHKMEIVWRTLDESMNFARLNDQQILRPE